MGLEACYLPELLKISGCGALLAVHGLFRMKAVGNDGGAADESDCDDTERGYNPGRVVFVDPRVCCRQCRVRSDGTCQSSGGRKNLTRTVANWQRSSNFVSSFSATSNSPPPYDRDTKCIRAFRAGHAVSKCVCKVSSRTSLRPYRCQRFRQVDVYVGSDW